MPSIRELKVVWQIRSHDAGRTPMRTTVSIPKAKFKRRRDAEHEVERLGHMYRYTDDFDPWTQDYPGQEVRGDSIGVGKAARRYIEAKRRPGGAASAAAGRSRRARARPATCGLR